MSTSIRIGIIGAGAIGRVHAKTFALTKDTVLAGMTDVNKAAAETVATENGIAKVFGSADELIKSPDIDAVIVGVPNKYHADLAIAALNAGKHVLLEKPMALNGEQAKTIVEAQKRTGKILMIAHQMRWEYLSQEVRKRVDSGSLGRIYSAKAIMLRKKAIPGWGSWFTRMAESGGGPLIDIGVHMIDLTRYLMGSPVPVSVYGTTFSEFGTKKKGIGTWGTPDWQGFFDVEDYAHALMKMDNGAVLSLEVSWAVNTDFDHPFAIHLIGSEGGASIYGGKAKIIPHVDTGSQPEEISAPKDYNARLKLSEHFLSCISENKQPISDGVSGMINNMVLDAIYESSKKGTAVAIR